MLLCVTLPPNSPEMHLSVIFVHPVFVHVVSRGPLEFKPSGQSVRHFMPMVVPVQPTGHGFAEGTFGKEVGGQNTSNAGNTRQKGATGSSDTRVNKVVQESCVVMVKNVE